MIEQIASLIESGGGEIHNTIDTSQPLDFYKDTPNDSESTTEKDGNKESEGQIKENTISEQAKFDTSEPLDFYGSDITKDADSPSDNETDICKQDKVLEEVDSKHSQSELSSQEKGNYGEMKQDQNLREAGYEKISDRMVTSLDEPLERGIDGVYEKQNGEPQFIIGEAKFGNSQLGDTQDGKQMSWSWIDNRLDDAVGKEKADEIRMEKILNPDNVGSYVCHIDYDGNVSYDRLDDNAQIVEKGVNFDA